MATNITAPPVALTIAGSDNSAGAGIQADLKTFTAFGVYGLTAVTAVVAEIPGKVKSLAPVELGILADQIELSLTAFPIRAVKTGMLWSSEVIVEVHSQFTKISKDSAPALVVDPVMVATSGDPLLESSAVDAYRELLFPSATLVTPNVDEAQVLLGRKISSLDELEKAGAHLSVQYGVPFLMKGGHLQGATAVDLLMIQGSLAGRYDSPYYSGIATHGTGCTFSAAITANLALGHDLPTSVQAAKHFVSKAISESFQWGNVQALNHGLPAKTR